MATTFPESKEDFTAENGVTYTWDVNRWRTKAYKLDESKLDEYLPLTGGKLTGKTTINKVREDSNSIAFSIAGRIRNNDNAIVNDILLKSYQRAEDNNTQADYIAYYGSSGGSTEILNRVTAQAEFASKEVLDGYLPLTGGTVTGELRVNKPNNQPIFEVTADKVELQKHATSITQLEPKEIINVGILDNLMRDPGPYGYLTGLATEKYVDDAIADIEIPSSDPIDLDGYLPLTGGTIDGLTTVTSTGANSDNAYVFNVQGPRLPEGQTSAFRVTAGGSVKAGHSSGAPFMATAANDLITKAYFDANQGGDVNLSGYLPLSGGTLTNALCFNRGEKPNVQLCIEPNSGSTDTNIYSLSDGQIRFRTSHTSDINDRNGSHIVLNPNNGEPETKIYHLVSPSNANMAANRQYVDETAASPAHLQWQYNGTVDNADDPGSGNMVWNPSGTDGIIGYMRFSFVTRDGLTDLGDGKFDDTIVSMEYGPVGTVWQWRSDVGKWKLMLQFRFKQFRWNYNNHFELGLTSQNGRRFEDIANAGYFVTVGGFF